MTRSWAQMEAFAKECKRIEKEGGDVLGYIRENWPSYTPRGTWYNLQRECLGRKPHQMTEGRPRKIEKEEIEVKRHGDAVEMAMSVIQVHKNGGDVRKHLLEHGYGDPAKWLCNIKFRFKTDHPEIYAELKDITLGREPRTKAEEPNPAPDEKKTGENPGKKPKGAETVVSKDGKEYVKMDKPSPTCCQPARQGGPIKWDDNEAMTNSLEEISMREPSIKEVPIKELKLRTLQGEMGTYEKLADDRMLFTGSPRLFTDCGYTVAEWFVLIEELQIAIKQLGLK